MQNKNLLKIIFLFSFINIFLFTTSCLSATNDFKQAANEFGKTSTIKTTDDVIGVVNKIVGIFYNTFFIITVFFILLAAYNYLFSAGQPAKIKLAKDQLLYAVIAVVVALLSYSAVAIINTVIQK